MRASKKGQVDMPDDDPALPILPRNQGEARRVHLDHIPGTTIPTMWLRMLDAPLDVRCGFLSDRSNQIDAAALARDEGDPASGADDRGWYQGCSEQKAERGGEEGMEHAPRAYRRLGAFAT